MHQVTSHLPQNIENFVQKRNYGDYWIGKILQGSSRGQEQHRCSGIYRVALLTRMCVTLLRFSTRSVSSLSVRQ